MGSGTCDDNVFQLEALIKEAEDKMDISKMQNNYEEKIKRQELVG